MDREQWTRIRRNTTRRLRALAAARSTITYAELVAEVDVPLETEGQHSLAALLRQISLAEHEAGRGLLTALVVRADRRGLPGGGFFELASAVGRDTSDRRRCWQDEVDRLFDENDPARATRHGNGPAG